MWVACQRTGNPAPRVALKPLEQCQIACTLQNELWPSEKSQSKNMISHLGRWFDSFKVELSLGLGPVAEYTLYITPTISYKSRGRSRYAGKGESVVHLMSANMVCRVDPLPEVLSTQLVRYRKPPYRRKSLYVQG